MGSDVMGLYVLVANRHCQVGPANDTSSEIQGGPVYLRECMENIFRVLESRVTSAGISPAQSYLFSAIYGCLTCVGLLGNGLIMAAVLRKPAMRRTRNFLMANLALSNFLLSSILYPLLWRPDQARYFPYGGLACKVGAAFPASNIYCSTLTIAAMAVERYHAIRQRKGTAMHLNRESVGRKAMYMCGCAGIWAVAVFLSLPFLLYYDVARYPHQMQAVELEDGSVGDFTIPFCQLGPTLSKDGYARLSIAVNILQSTSLYLVPSVTLIIFNFRLSRYVAANSIPAVPHSVSHSQASPCRPPPSPKPRRPTRVSLAEESTIISNEQPTVVRALVKPRASRRRSRLRMLLLAMGLSNAILWLPYTVYVFTLDFGFVDGNGVSTWIDFTVKLVSVLSVAANPIIYGFLNNNFRPEMLELVGIVFPCVLGFGTSPATTNTALTNGDVSRLTPWSRSGGGGAGRRSASVGGPLGLLIALGSAAGINPGPPAASSAESRQKGQSLSVEEARKRRRQTLSTLPLHSGIPELSGEQESSQGLLGSADSTDPPARKASQ